MIRQTVSLLLVTAIVAFVSARPVRAATPEEKQAARAEKVRAGIAKLGTGPDARVKVTLGDKRKAEGYVASADDVAFVVADASTGGQTRVPYADVSKVKGNNISTGAVIAISAGIAVGVVLLVLFAMYASNES